ncbi:30S ribosomal protein S4 [Candidatus Nitrososphaera sp. FF02]|jgi:small subunit ribosomal protein S4|uniref:30S ribosomal protein S4 n=1 Tax=Candidatus Nitrososphaera sp. FF02 TaxID=3398226 RepID=UPI0039EA3C05
MGDPRKQKKLFHRPRRIWTTDQLNMELYIMGSYGLRNKRELWKAQTEMARVRNQARALLALSTEARAEKEKRLLNFLSRIGLAKEGATLDDILNLKVEDLLERRLQTIVMKRMGAKSPYQARQIVSHGHVSIGNRKVNRPGYIVKTEEEAQILLHIEIQAAPAGGEAAPAS